MPTDPLRADGRIPNRWLIAAMGTVLQLCLGTVYAWSYFQQPLVEAYGWSNSQVAGVFSLAICSLGIAAACGSRQLPRFGPRRLAMTGGFLFGAGYLLAAAALHGKSLALVYLGYGLVGGVGLGLGYVTPVATVARWFPDKKGLVTGMVIMGFGFGALVMSKAIAPGLSSIAGGDLVKVFAWLGAGFMFVAVPAAWFLQNPPSDGPDPPSDGPSSVSAKREIEPPAALTQSSSLEPMPRLAPLAPLAGRGVGGEGFSERMFEDLATARFARLWIIFFCNILAGISIISFQSPLFQDLWRTVQPSLSKETLAAYGATLIATSSLFNGIGRIFWGGLSDRIGRRTAFQIMLGTQTIAFVLLAQVRNPWVFAAVICYVLLCYGGGFGTMPSMVLDRFGPSRMAAVYGAVLTAWSAAGIAGPQLVAVLKDRFPEQAGLYAFSTSAAFLALGLALTFGDRRSGNRAAS